MTSIAIRFSSPRRFQLWSYRTGHGLLLLRSNKDDVEPTRVDVALKPVAAINLPDRFASLVVRDATTDEEAAIRSTLGRLGSSDQQVFIVEGGAYTGWVLASTVATAEDGGSYADPSLLI